MGFDIELNAFPVSTRAAPVLRRDSAERSVWIFIVGLDISGREKLAANMKAFRTPAILLIVLCLGLVFFIVSSSSGLPDRVAVHFGVAGNADGWMTRTGHVVFFSAVAVGVPAILGMLAIGIRFMPAEWINVPRRDYWLAPERRQETVAVIGRQLIWLACLLVLFFAGVQWLILRANAVAPPRLPGMGFILLLVAFFVALLFWILAFMRRFFRGE